MTSTPTLSAARLEALMEQSIDTLSAILADPALPAQQRADLALRLLALGLGTPESPDRGVLPVEFVTVRDFLPPEAHAAVVEAALSNRDRFIASTVTTGALDYRKSQVLHAAAFPGVYETIRDEVMAALPAVLESLAYPDFPVASVEMQMTAHGDGAFFKVHQDTGSPDTATRALTYVYYFQVRQPRGFSGGALRLYQTRRGPPVEWDSARFREIEPLDNVIVFFDSCLMHEVMPVNVPSGDFADFRFTLNGWLRR